VIIRKKMLHNWCKLWPILLGGQNLPLQRSLSDTFMATALAQKRVVEAPVIPDRLYFKIGDAARICGVETYVLRFWETQFPQLKPGKSGTGQRLYRRRDV
jgi:hypothetical protein